MTPVDSGGRFYSDVVDDSARSGFTKTITATGNSTAFKIEDVASIIAELSATTATGTTPSLTLTLECSDDGTNWAQVGPAFPALTGTGTTLKETFDVDNWTEARWHYVVTGTTPSFVAVLATKINRSQDS